MDAVETLPLVEKWSEELQHDSASGRTGLAAGTEGKCRKTVWLCRTAEPQE